MVPSNSGGPKTPDPLAAFCAVERNGVTGFVRSSRLITGFFDEGGGPICQPGVLGFVTHLGADPDSTIAVGTFVQRCVQQTEDGLIVSIGAICADTVSVRDLVTSSPEQPRPPLSDGDLIPLCRTTGSPNWEIVVGPPCTFFDQPLAIIRSASSIERRSDCFEAVAFSRGLLEPYERLIPALTQLAQWSSPDAATRDSGFVEILTVLTSELEAVREELAAVKPSERLVQVYAAGAQRRLEQGSQSRPTATAVNQDIVQQLSDLLSAVETSPPSLPHFEGILVLWEEASVAHSRFGSGHCVG